MLKFVALLLVVGVARAEVPWVNSSLPLPDGRIVGGSSTDIALYPWQVSLQYGTSHFCGAVLISPIWILTAAHCITDGYSTNLYIRAGSTNRASGGIRVAVNRIMVHASWGRNGMDYDIAACQLASAVSHPSAVAARLPSAGYAIDVGTSVSITGWGALSEGGASTNTLQVVTVPSVSLAQCRSAYGTSAVTDRMLCAGLLGVGGKDACQGDSGGPAIANGFLVGLVSWGSGCARPQYPGVYTKVSELRAWISANTGI